MRKTTRAIRPRAASWASACCFTFTLLGLAASPALAGSTIHPGDHLQIRVFNHADLSTEVVTNSDGSAALPVTGNIPLAGLSEHAAAERIESALKPYLKYPSVNVRITQQAQSIFFTGAYNGVAQFVPGETLGAAVGNLTQKSSNANGNVFNATSIDLRKVRVERNGKLLPTVFNLEAFSRTGQSGEALEPGDTIQLATKPIEVQVRGNTKTPGPVYVYQGDSLAQAVSQSGGFSDTTSYSRIGLTRKGMQQTITSASPVMSEPAQDGDMIVLQPALHIDVVGSVNRPGDLILKSGNTLYAAIYDAGGPERRADLSKVKVTHDGVTSSYDLSQVTRGDTSVNVALADGDTVVVPRRGGIDMQTVGGSAALFSSLRFLLLP